MAAKEDTTEVENNQEFSITCFPCTEAKKTTVAIKYCLECKSYMCEECIQDHNKFAALRRHQLVEITDAAVKEEESDQSKEVTGVECGLHYGQNIDSYCKDHDEVCCPICITIKHRSCKQTEKIQKAADGLKKSKEFKDTKEALEKFHEYANKEKRDRNINLTALDEEKSKLSADIDTFEENLIQRIKDLANASRENLRVTHAKHVCDVTSDVKELDTVMSGLMESLNKLDNTDGSEIAAFVSIKNCQKTFAEMKQVVKDLSDKWLQTDLHFQFNDNIIANGTTALGNVIEETKNDHTYFLRCKSKANIAVQTDKETCEVTAICQLSDETFVVIDKSNANLKRLTDTFDVIDCMNLKKSPKCMCVTGPQEVAVTLEKKNCIQFVTADDKFTLGPSFNIPSIVSKNCNAINYDWNEGSLYLSCKNVTEKQTSCKILVYNRKGNVLKIYNTEFETYGRYTPSGECHILIHTNKILLYDSEDGLIVFEKTAEKKGTVTKERYFRLDTRILCFLSGNKMLKLNYKNTLLLSIDGEQIKTLKIDYSPQIQTAVFNKQKSTLLVAGQSNEIMEYKLPFKLLKLLE